MSDTTPSPSPSHPSTRIYLLVFLWLAVFTVITVALSYLHLPKSTAIPLALLVATIKATLVGAYFMHLRVERRVIFAIIVVACFFMIALVVVPLLDTRGLAGQVSFVP